MNQRQAAIYYLDKRVFGRAEKLLREWVLAHPDDVYIHMELIWCFYKRSNSYNRWRECDAFFEKVYDCQNTRAIRSFVRAEQLYYEGQEDESLVHYKAAIAEGLNVPVVHHSLGTTLKTLGRKEDAKKEFEIALQQNPQFLPTLDLYGHLLFDEGRFDCVESILQPLNELDRKSFTLQSRGALEDLEDLNRLRSACSILRLSIKLGHEDKIREASMVLWPVFLEHTDNCWFVRTMVYLFYRLDRFNFSKKRLEEVIEKETLMSSYVTGLLFWYKDNYEEAITAYNDAINNGLDEPLVRCARSLAYNQLGKYQEQEQDLIAALSCAPWFIYAREDLAVLKYEKEKFDEIEQLANVTPEEYDCAFNYDISGNVSLATLEAVALSSLLKQSKTKEALLRVKCRNVPCEDERLYFDRAMVFTESHDFHEAALELTKAMKLNCRAIGINNEDDKKRLQLLIQNESNCFGVALASAILPAFGGNCSEAKDNLKILVQHFPDEPEGWYHLANLSLTLGNKEQAKKEYRKALVLDYSHKNALTSLCKLLYEEGNIKELNILSKRLRTSSIPLEYAFDLAEKNEQHELSKEIASVLLGIDPNNWNAKVCVLRGLNPESLEYAHVAKSLTASMPFEFERRTLIARTLFLNGKPEEALKEYDNLFSEGFESIHDLLIQSLAYVATKSTKDSCGKKN
ncbi:MAG: tetratricopeptide repeat protein [Sedimentisphaerales bacterium]